MHDTLFAFLGLEELKFGGNGKGVFTSIKIAETNSCRIRANNENVFSSPGICLKEIGSYGVRLSISGYLVIPCAFQPIYV